MNIEEIKAEILAAERAGKDPAEFIKQLEARDDVSHGDVGMAIIELLVLEGGLSKHKSYGRSEMLKCVLVGGPAHGQVFVSDLPVLNVPVAGEQMELVVDRGFMPPPLEFLIYERSNTTLLDDDDNEPIDFAFYAHNGEDFPERLVLHALLKSGMLENRPSPAT